MNAAAHRAVIAGTGVAGAVAACDLRARGFEVWMLEVPRRRPVRSLEAIPAAAVAALHELGLAPCLARASPVTTIGFDNAWDGAATARIVEGTWVCVERDALARSLRDEAIARGAHLVPVHRLPPVQRCPQAGGFRWGAPGLPAASAVAIDATGRAAAWSRPTVHTATRVAMVFRGPGSPCPRRGRIVRGHASWAYALFHPHHTTVGIVAPPVGAARPGEIPHDLAQELALSSPGAFRLERRCAAHAQWATAPAWIGADHAQLAIGDAALAYDPMAGHGVRFAIASASAAAACVETLREAGDARPEARSAAALYYDDFVASARRRHVAQLDARARGVPATPDPAVPPDLVLQFSAELVATGLRHGDRIVADTGIRLATGELARWLGPLDLLALRTLASSPRPARELCAALRTSGLAPAHAEAVLRWCLGRGVLTATRG